MPFDGVVTRAVTEELKKILPGKVGKIYQPTSTELVLTIRNQGQNHTLLLSIHPTYSRLHVTEDDYTNPKEPPMFCMLLRKHLGGSILESIEQYGMERIVIFTFKTRNEIGDTAYKTLIFELMGKHSNVMLIDKEKGHIIDSLKHVSSMQNSYRAILPGQMYKLPPAQSKQNLLKMDSEAFIKKLDFNTGRLDKQIVQTLVGFSPLIARELVHRAGLGGHKQYMNAFIDMKQLIEKNNYTPAVYHGNKEDFHVIPITLYTENQEVFTSTNRMVDAFYSGKAERDRVQQQAKDLYRLIKNEKDKNERKLKKHNQTLKKAEGAETYQRLGELLTAHMHLVKPGDDTVSVIDYYDPEQTEITIELNPDKTPSENAQDFFKSYQKLKTSKQKVENEIVKANKEMSYLDGVLQQIDTAKESDVEEIREELRDEGYLKKQRQHKKPKKQPKPVPEAYESTKGTPILVGKNNKQNEYLTMKLAGRDEFWLHTQNIPGSHVIIRSREPDDDTLMEAAQIAAYFSKSQQSSSVPVDYTKVRHVKKPNGAKPGFVTYGNQKTLFVTPDKTMVDTLRKTHK